MEKSEFSVAVDAIRNALRPELKKQGFGVRARTFNRVTPDGLTHVVNLQMGRFDPPGTVPMSGRRESLHGQFTVNLGVYVPEVGLIVHEACKGWVAEYDCCIRGRLGELRGRCNLWWPARQDTDVINELRERIAEDGLPWLERRQSRDQILAEMRDRHRDQVRLLLSEQASEAAGSNPRHAEYVRTLATRLGVGEIDS